MRALDAHTARLEDPSEGPRPVLLPTYHGTWRHANLTALVALLLQRYEIPVLVHGLGRVDVGSGRRRSRRRCGAGDASQRPVMTADVLWELGVEPATSLADAQARLRYDNIAYVPSALLAPGLARLFTPPTRDSLPTVAHSVALLIDPFGGDGYRVIGAASAHDMVSDTRVPAGDPDRCAALPGCGG